MKDKQYSYEQFLEIIETLRSENGCPWDREQTHKSLRPCVIEEAAELVEAIGIYESTNNAENLVEELGDLLLQVVIHAQIAKEAGVFTMNDVVQVVSEKMVRRHPHVFGDVIAKDSTKVLENWEEIKKKEKEGKDWVASGLREIPVSLPALIRATKVKKKLAKEYGEEVSFAQNIQTLEQAVALLKSGENIDKKELSNILGEMLFTISDINGKFKLSGEEMLIDQIETAIREHDYCK